MKYAFGMDSGVITYMPSFIKSGSGVQHLIGGNHTQTEWRSRKPALGKVG
jgi:hypothetical protein